MVESRTQERLSQGESEHWPQQQCSPMYSFLQSSASRFEQGLPGEARLHSDKRFNNHPDQQGLKCGNEKYVGKEKMF